MTITTRDRNIRPTRLLASALAVLLAVAGAGLSVSSAAAADTAEIVVPDPYRHSLSVSRSSLFSANPLMLPRSSTSVTLLLPDPALELEQVDYRIYGADFEVRGAATLDTMARTATIELPGDLFDVREGHSPLKQVEVSQDSTGALVFTPTADDYYGIDLTGSGSLADSNPYFVTEFAGDAGDRSDFTADVTVRATDATERTDATIDLTFSALRASLDDVAFSHIDWRAAPGVQTIASGDTVLLRAEPGFWTERLTGTRDVPPRPVLTYSEQLDSVGELELPSTLSADGRDLVVTIPDDVSTYQFGAEPRIEVILGEGVESDGHVAILVPVTIAGTADLPAAPGQPTATAGAGNGSIFIEWTRAAALSQQSEYRVRVFENGEVTGELRPGTIALPFVELRNAKSGVEYTFDVAGVNQNGVGALSPRSEPIVLNDDTVAPTIVATVPASNTRTVEATTTVTVQLSEPALFPLESPSLTLQGGGVSTQAPIADYDFDSRTLTFAPAEPLAPDTRYTAILTGVSDLSGNALARSTWSFITGPGPSILSVSPPSGSTVGRERTVTVRFDEPVLGASAKTARLVNVATGARVAATVRLDTERTRLVIDPTESLAGGARYRVVLIGGPLAIRDRSGNPLASRQWTFTAGTGR